MPRQVRATAPVDGGQIQPRAGRTRISILLVLILVSSSAGAWYFGGNRTEQIEATKKALPLEAADIKSLVVTREGRTATFERGSDGKLAPLGEVAPSVVATPVPTPDGATPVLPTVVIAPGTRAESIVTQLRELRVDRVVFSTPTDNPEYGLDRPIVSFEVVPKVGERRTFAVGAKTVNDSSYYVRRENDTILVSKYALDGLIKIATDVTADVR